MTPKMKANELIEQFYQVNKNHDLAFAKDCALIAVGVAQSACEYIEAAPWVLPEHSWDYWQQVKEELQKL